MRYDGMQAHTLNEKPAELTAEPTAYRWVGERDDDEPIISGPYTRLHDVRAEVDVVWSQQSDPPPPGFPIWRFRRMTIFDAYGAVVYSIARPTA